MAFDLTDLINCLESGDNLDIGYHRVFGGQILAQMIAAASHASPDKVVKSINVLFPREGDTSKRMNYAVDKLQDGRTFGTTMIIATQDDKVISAATVSMHSVEESALHRTDPLPMVGTPNDAAPTEIPLIPFEIRVVNGVDLASHDVGPAAYEMWLRAPDVPEDAPISVHQALLAHSTDLTIIGTALRPFDGVSQADSTISLHTAVTSHSIWFHQPFVMNDWLLLAQTSPVVAGGRAYGRGDVFDSSGQVVASFAQESMIRAITPPA